MRTQLRRKGDSKGGDIRKITFARLTEKHAVTPPWFHWRGYNMKVESINERDNLIVISDSGSGGVTVVIQRTGKNVWRVVREHECSLAETLMSNRQFLAAFGQTDDKGEKSVLLCRYYNADSAGYGVYIREGQFLTLPFPNLRDSECPSASIYLSEEIWEVVHRLTA